MRWLVFLCFTAVCIAQVEFQVQPREIGINQAVQFSVVIHNDTSGRQPTFPEGMKSGDFRLANPNPSTQRSVSIINGKMEQTTTLTFQFQPTKKGKLTFPSITLGFDGKTYKSEPVEIVVGEEARQVQPQRRDPFADFFNDNDPFFRDPFGRGRRPQSRQAEIFAEARVPKTEYFVGEPIPFSINLVRTPDVQIAQQGSRMDPPEFTDFWVEELEEKAEPRRFERNNTLYEELNIDRRRLYANKPGILTIKPVKFTLNVAAGGGIFANWQSVQRNSDPIKLTIKPLPAAGKPADFSGLVGQFQLEGKLEKTSLSVGESTSLQLTVSGEGNFSALTAPALDLPRAEFEVFDGGTPTTETQKGIVRSKTWVFALVPQRPGKLVVKLPLLSYFDLGSQSYKLSGGKELVLDVRPGSGSGMGTGQPGSASSAGRLAGESNLAFIKLQPLQPLSRGKDLDPMWLVSLVGGILSLDLALFLYLFWRDRSSGQREHLRPKYALRHFRRALQRLPGADSSPANYYGALSQAMLDYFGDKWQRPGQGISLDYIEQEFNRRGLDQALCTPIREALEACDLARFTAAGSSSRDKIREKVTKSIEAVEEVL